MNQNTLRKVIQVGNIIAVVATIIVNALAVLLPLNGKTTQELSDAYPNLFVPAGITFSIWSIIYLFMIIFALYQAQDLMKKEPKELPFLKQIGFLFILSSLANICWIFSWHYEQVALSLFFMIILLLSLLVIYMKLNIGRTHVSLSETIGVRVLFSLYLGWITVATIANVTALLVSVGWTGGEIPQETWTVLVLSVAVLITLLMLLRRKDVVYSMVVIWALLGIYLKRTSPSFLNSTVATTAEIGMVLVTIGVVIVLLWQVLKRKKPMNAAAT